MRKQSVILELICNFCIINFREKYNKKLNLIVPMTIYGVNCYANDVRQLPEKVRYVASYLNKAFQQVGVIFKVSHEILPCNGRSGTFNMSRPTGEQITKFSDQEIKDRSKFSILTTWGTDTPAGFHQFPGTWGWFIFDGLKSESLGPHELGHGWGLPHTFTRTDPKDNFRGCECAENMNTPNAETGDLCEVILIYLIIRIHLECHYIGEMKDKFQEIEQPWMSKT